MFPKNIKNIKNDNIIIRLSKEQKEYIKKYCSKKNKTITNYILDLIENDIDK